MIPWWLVNLGDAAAQAAYDAVLNRKINLGPLVKEFEQKMAQLLGVKHVIATTSGSTATMVALYACGIRPGDEVIVPDLTWIAPANAVHLLGAIPVLVDVNADYPTISISGIEKAITPKTKGILPVHLSGMEVDMPAVRKVAQKYGLTVLEDAAQSLLVPSSEGGYLGTHSSAGCFSLSLSKLLSSGQGGFIVTNDEEIAQRCLLFRTQGTKSIIEASWAWAGGNFRYSDLQAALVLAQLPLIEQRINHLKAIHNCYATGIHNKHISMLGRHLPDGAFQIFIEICCEKREELRDYLLEHEIESRPYYPALHTAPHLAGRNKGPYPNSCRLAAETLFLPSGPDQPIENVEKTISVLNNWNS